MGLHLYAKYVYKFFPSRSVRKIAAVRFLFSTKTYFEGRSFVQLTCPFSSQPGVQGTGVGVQVQEWEFRQFIVCCVVYQMQGLHRDERYQKVASGEYTGIWTGTTQERMLPILEERWVHRDLDMDYTGAKVTSPWRTVSTQGFGYGLHTDESYQSLTSGEYTGIWTELHRSERYQYLTSGEYTVIWKEKLSLITSRYVPDVAGSRLSKTGTATDNQYWCTRQQSTLKQGWPKCGPRGKTLRPPSLLNSFNNAI